MNEKLDITLHEYSFNCGDGCCNNWGNIITINGKELACHNTDTATILTHVLEHLGYEVEVTNTYDEA